MSPKLALVFLLAVTATVANGQNNPTDSIRDSYHIFFPAMGKDILAAHVGAHYYKIVNVYEKPSEVYVDNRRIDDAELSKYNDIIERIKSSVKDDEEERDMRQMARDRRQAERDREQETRDREQNARDREQQVRDRARQQLDREQQRRDQEQARRDREQQVRDAAQQRQERKQQLREQEEQREESRHEQEQEMREQVQERNVSSHEFLEENGSSCNCDSEMYQDEQEHREQAAEDRAMLKKGIQILVDEHVINNSQNLKTLVLTDSDISVNGVRQPENVYQQVRTKLGEWAIHGLSYDTAGSTDNYSLSIND